MCQSYYVGQSSSQVSERSTMMLGILVAEQAGAKGRNGERRNTDGQRAALSLAIVPAAASYLNNQFDQ